MAGTNSENKSILALDIAKAIGITAIVLTHIDQLYKVRNIFANLSFFSIIGDLFFVMGHYGVSLFIVTSGFGVTWSLLHKKTISWKRWLYQRALKIYPLFWISFAFFLIVFNIGYTLVDWIPSKIIGEKEILATVSGLQAYVGMWGGNVNPVYWFNSLIIGLSLIFPFLYLLAKRFDRRILLLAIFIISLSTSLLVINGSYLLFRYLPITRLFEFFAGMFLAHYFFEKQTRWDNSYASFLGLAGAIGLFLLYAIKPTPLINILLVILTGPLLMIFFLTPQFLAIPSLLQKPIQFLSRHSHGIFLFHLPLLEPGNYMQSPNLFFLFLLYVAILSIVVFAAEKGAAIVYRRFT